MKRALNFLLGLAVFGPLVILTASSPKAYAQAAGEMIVSRTAEINGVKLHYMTAATVRLSYSCTAMPRHRGCGSRSFPRWPSASP